MIEVLRLIQNDEYLAASLGLSHQQVIQSLVKGDFIAIQSREFELGCQVSQKIVRLASGKEDERSTGGVPVLRQQLKQQRRLSQSRLAQKNSESKVRFDRLDHRIQRLTMPPRHKQKPGIGCYSKG